MKSSSRDLGLVLLLLLLIMGVAAGLRFYNLGTQSLWSDEGNSAALAMRSLTEIAHDAANDIHPPLYYWLLRLWTQVFGVSETPLRSLSALLGVLLVLATTHLGSICFNRNIGLAAGFIAALAPFQVYYSQEARMYMLLALEATIAVQLFCWYIRREDALLSADRQNASRPLRWLPFSGQLLVLVWVAGLYTHYAFPLIIALLSGLYLLWVLGTRRRGWGWWRLLRWALMLVLTVGLYAPWLPTAARQLTTWPGVDVTAGLGVQLRNLLATLSLGPVGLAQATAQAAQWWIWVLPVLALVGALPWALFRRTQQPIKGSNWMAWLSLVTWAAAPLAMIIVLGLYRGAYLKFLLIASPAFAILLARSVLEPANQLMSKLPDAPAKAPAEATPLPWWRGVLAAGWIVASFAVIGGISGAVLARYYEDPAMARDDYRGITQFIVATAQPSDAIVLTAPGQAEVFSYYYHGNLPIFALPRQRPLDSDATLTELKRLLTYDKVYAVLWATEEADPDGLVTGWINQQGYKTLDQWYGNVRLAVYVMPEHRTPDEIVEDQDIRLGSDITLLGHRSWKLTPTAGEVTQLQLQWRAENTPLQRYKVFLQLLDARDQVIAQRDAEPAGETRPTSTWTPGEIVLDNHGLLIPPGTPPGCYRRIVGLYDAETLERLKLPDGSDFISLSPVTVTRAKTAPPLAAFDMQYPQRFDFGGITLLGHDRYKRGFGHVLETTLVPGDLLHLTLYWQANVAPRADWWFNLTLSDAGGRVVANLQAPLVSDIYATTLWQEGEIVRGEHDLGLPPDLPPDTYRLSLILLPDDKTEAGTAYLGTVKIQEPTQEKTP